MVHVPLDDSVVASRASFSFYVLLMAEDCLLRHNKRHIGSVEGVVTMSPDKMCSFHPYFFTSDLTPLVFMFV